MYIIPVNIIAVFVAAVAMQVVGLLWYSPILFGVQWEKFRSVRADLLPEELKKEVGRTYLLGSIGAFVMSYMLTLLLSNLVVVNIFQGIQAAFLIWLGFIIPVLLYTHLFSVSPRPWAVFILRAGHFLASLIIAGGIIAAFSF